MDILLVMSQRRRHDMRILVKLHSETLNQEVRQLLLSHQNRQAFQLVLKRAEVAEYLPEGTNPGILTDLILFEDLLT